MNTNRNKNLRKLSSRDDSREFSQQSVLSAMDRFVQAVDNMNETVMVPSRLMDMHAPVPTTAPQPGSPDLYGFYTMLNSVKTQLIWGPGNLLNAANNNNNIVNSAAVAHEQHKETRSSPISSPFPSQPPSRRLSTVSSLSLSDSDAESTCSETSDSGATDGTTDAEQQSARIAGNFRHHLVGLYHVLQQLTDTADVLTCRYQQEVESSAS